MERETLTSENLFVRHFLLEIFLSNKLEVNFDKKKKGIFKKKSPMVVYRQWRH